MNKQPTCEERIDAELEREMDRLRKIMGDDDAETLYANECRECEHEWQSEEEFEDCPKCGSDDTWCDEAEPDEEPETRDSYMEGVLEISALHIVYRVGLSTGGPADGFYLYVDPEDKTIDKIEYYFQDWFDGATRTLHGDEFDMVRDMFEPYVQIA